MMAATCAVPIVIQLFRVPFIVSPIVSLCRIASLYPPGSSVIAGVLWNTRSGTPRTLEHSWKHLNYAYWVCTWRQSYYLITHIINCTLLTVRHGLFLLSYRVAWMCKCKLPASCCGSLYVDINPTLCMKLFGLRVASVVLKLAVRQPYLTLACSAMPLLTRSNLNRAVYRSPHRVWSEGTVSLLPQPLILSLSW
jgi:hypothetical protein